MSQDERNTGASAGSREADRIVSGIEASGWAGSVAAQVATVRAIREGDTLTEAARARCVAAFAKAKGWSGERAGSVLAMTSPRDIERSLQATTDAASLRLPNEESYPKSGWIGKYLNYSQGNEVPTAYHFWTAITVLGAAAKRSYFLDMGVYRIYPNQFILLLGPSGLKKSTALNIGQDVLGRMNRKLKERGASDHDLVKIMPNKMGPEVFLKEMKSWPLGVAGEGWTDSIALILSSELSVLIGKQVFHSDMFIEILTDLYDCPESWRAGTITRGDEEFHNIAVSLLGCSTPDWAMDSISDKMFKGGFFGRLVLCWRDFSNKAFAWPQFLDPVVAEELADHLAGIASIPVHTTFTLSDSARAWYEDFYYANHERMVREQEEELRGYLSRKHNHVFSTAMALALSDGTTHISDFHLRQANYFLDIEERESLRRVVSTVGQHEDDKLAVRMMQRIWKVSAGEPISRTDLDRKAMYVCGNAERFDLTLRSLKRRGWLVESEEPSTNGRTRTVYSITNWHPGMASGEE